VPVGRCRRRLRGGSLPAVAALVAAPALGAPCGKPDLVAAFPDDGATGVPTNATLSARYAPTAEYLGEPLELRHPAGTDEPVEGEWAPATGMLTVVPPEGLAPGDEYTMVWPRLRGLGTASLGRGLSATFTVGDGPDEAPPRFDGLLGIDWDVDRDRDDCTDSLEERFVFDLTAGAASDDFPSRLLTLHVFQTRGPGVSGSQGAEPVLVAAYPGDGRTVRIERSIHDGEGEVCFAAFVADLAGRTSGGTDRERCVETVAPPFFYGCQAAAPSGGAHAGLPLVLGALALTLRRRRALG
jgi:hypothetical protein